MAPRPRRLLLTTSRLPTDSLVIDSVEWDRLRGARALVRLIGTAGAKLPAGRVRLSLDSRARSHRFESLPPLGGHTQGPWSAAFELPRKLLPLLERGASVQIGRLVVAVPGSEGRSGRGSARADEYAPVDVPAVLAPSAGAPDPASSVPAGDRAVEAEPDFVPATPVPDPLMTRSAAEAAPPSGETGGDVEDAQLALTSVTDLLTGLRTRLKRSVGERTELESRVGAHELSLEGMEGRVHHERRLREEAEARAVATSRRPRRRRERSAGRQRARGDGCGPRCHRPASSSRPGSCSTAAASHPGAARPVWRAGDGARSPPRAPRRSSSARRCARSGSARRSR